MSWTTLQERFLTRLVHRHYHPGRVQSYRNWLGHLAEYAASQDLRPADVTAEVADAWARHLEGLQYSLQTRLNALGIARVFYDWAVSDGAVFQNPFGHLVLPRVKPEERRCLTPEEVEALLAQPDRRTLRGFRDYIFMALMYGVGVRLSECVGADVPDVDLRNAAFFVRHAKAGQQRLLPLAPRLHADLSEWLRTGRPPLHRRPKERALFLTQSGTRLGLGSMEKLVQRYGRQAGLGAVSPHLLRHAFGSHLLANGADLESVRQLLGHEYLASTQIYTHLAPGALEEHLRRMHPRFQSGPEPS
jgi:integrase/recombinase XerD